MTGGQKTAPDWIASGAGNQCAGLLLRAAFLRTLPSDEPFVNRRLVTLAALS
jgi:hypothetical protein